MSTLSTKAILDRRLVQPDRLANGSTIIDLQDALRFICKHRNTDLTVLVSDIRVKISKKEAERLIKDRIDSIAAALEAKPEYGGTACDQPFFAVSHLAHNGTSFATIMIGKENYDRFNS